MVGANLSDWKVRVEIDATISSVTGAKSPAQQETIADLEMLIRRPVRSGCRRDQRRD